MMSPEEHPNEERAKRWATTTRRAANEAAASLRGLNSGAPDAWIDSGALVSIALSLSVIAEVLCAHEEPVR